MRAIAFFAGNEESVGLRPMTILIQDFQALDFERQQHVLLVAHLRANDAGSPTSALQR
jgi:hypothetical protein